MLTTAYTDAEPLSTLRAFAKHACEHQLCSDPAKADAILFVEHSHYDQDPFFTKLRRHPLVRNFPEKVFIYNEHDQPWCMLPGLYCSMPARHFDARYQAAVRFVRLLNPLMQARVCKKPDILYSFVGQCRSRLRRKIPGIPHHPRAVIEDMSAFNPFGTDFITKEHERYAEIIGRSKFVLCPRGAGTSSIRLFEVLKAGKVPVIIADDWVTPEGPDWATCAVRVQEQNICHLSTIISEQEDRWPMMAEAASQTWLNWFADEVIFDRFGSLLQNLQSRKPPKLQWRELEWALRLGKQRICRLAR